MKKAVLLSCAATFFYLVINAMQHEAHAAGKRYLMGSIGDSITAGTLADQSAMEPVLGAPDQDGVRHPIDPSLPGSIFSLENKMTYSWASGRKIASHYERLKDSLKRQGEGSNIVYMNEAIPGEVAKKIYRQAERIRDAMSTGEFVELKYVTLFIGNNDACSRTDLEDMRQQMRAAFWQLAQIRQKEPVRVLVTGIPAIPELGRQEIKDHRIPGSMTCEEVRRKVFGSCRHLINWDSPEEYRQKMDEVIAKNQLIEESVRDAQNEFPTLDLTFTNVLFGHNIPADWLAVDCFHPNKEGQSEISRLLWDEQPWFK